MDPRLELRNIMTPAPYTVNAADRLVDAKKQMSTRNVRHFPVRDGETVIGILSQRDISIAVALAKHVVDEEALTVRDVCSGDPYIVDVGERLDRVLNYMANNKIGSAVITENSEMIGIVTTTDICRVCADFFHEFYEQTS